MSPPRPRLYLGRAGRELDLPRLRQPAVAVYHDRIPCAALRARRQYSAPASWRRIEAARRASHVRARRSWPCAQAPRPVGRVGLAFVAVPGWWYRDGVAGSPDSVSPKAPLAAFAGPRPVKTSADGRVGRRSGVVLRGKTRIGPILVFPFCTTPRGRGRAVRRGLSPPGATPGRPWRSRPASTRRRCRNAFGTRTSAMRWTRARAFRRACSRAPSSWRRPH